MLQWLYESDFCFTRIVLVENLSSRMPHCQLSPRPSCPHASLRPRTGQCLVSISFPFLHRSCISQLWSECWNDLYTSRSLDVIWSWRDHFSNSLRSLVVWLEIEAYAKLAYSFQLFSWGGWHYSFSARITLACGNSVSEQRAQNTKKKAHDRSAPWMTQQTRMCSEFNLSISAHSTLYRSCAFANNLCAKKSECFWLLATDGITLTGRNQCRKLTSSSKLLCSE